MKIEKINDNQIRCTLSHQDLVDRELKLSELAYGTEKAKALFHDMMQQASFELGFEAENIPIMIEAIPVSRETLILIITKVENPDELDTSFSKFSPENGVNRENLLSRLGELSELLDEHEDDMSVDEEDITESYEETYEDAGQDTPPEATFNEQSENVDVGKIFAFYSLDDVIRFAKSVNGSYLGTNVLYKDNRYGRYYLIMNKSDHATEEFTRICNAASEYGRLIRSQYTTISHFNEHFELFIENDAVATLASL